MTTRESEGLSRARRTTMMAAIAAMLLVPFGAALPQRPNPLPQPSEAQTGAAFYPGSTYLAEISGGMSMGETYYWVFVTSDSPAKVAAFYKARTGRTPQEVSGSYLFDLARSSNPYLPEHGIIIEPDKQLTAGPPKTSITFVKPK